MFKKLTTMLVMLAFLNTQTYAKAVQLEAEKDIGNIISLVSQGAGSSEIMDEALSSVIEAKRAGVTEKEYVEMISKKLSLELSEEEVAESIADMKADHSKERLTQLAEELAEINESGRVVAVLLTFLISSLLLVGFFFMIADVSGYPVTRG